MDRDAEMAALAAEVGARWATAWIDELRRDGRLVAGGWPGTMTEARARIASRLASSVGERLSLTAAEVQGLVKAAYVAARNEWLARALPDDP